MVSLKKEAVERKIAKKQQTYVRLYMRSKSVIRSQYNRIFDANEKVLFRNFAYRRVHNYVFSIQ